MSQNQPFDERDNSLEHMYQSSGKNWPVAFYSYYKQGVDQQIDTDGFASLMTLEDPLIYLNTDMGNRLDIDKYIINASGDDFYGLTTVIFIMTSYPVRNPSGLYRAAHITEFWPLRSSR